MASKTAIVSHDAGGAEIISSYLRRNALDCLFVLAGPALNVFARKLGALEPTSLEDAIERASSVITGTSWQSDLEWQALCLARRRGRRSVAFLDHWGSYQERFERSGTRCLPDELWVGDEDAARIAHACFGELPVRMVPNPYLDDMRLEIAALSSEPRMRSGGTSILYVCEPVREHAARQHGDERYWGYVEEDAINFFFDNVEAIAADVGRIRVRPHPSEPVGKYSWVLGRTAVPVEISTATTLPEDIASADIVVGCQSMAMVVGLLAGRRVISSIPDGGRECVLPQAAIEFITDLVATPRAPRRTDRRST